MFEGERRRGTVLWLLVALIVIIVVVAVVIVVASSLLNPFGFPMGMMGFGMMFMMVPVIVLIVIIIAVILLASRPSPPYLPYQYPPATTPLQMLDLRYSRGEITREQYQQMRSDLEGREAQKRA